MHKLACLAFAALLAVLGTSPVHAMSPEEARRACDTLQQAVEEARKDMIRTAMPRKDPAQTFNDATQSCLQGIVNIRDIFQFRNITLATAQAILRQQANQMLTAACQAATQEFNRQVNDALAEVNSSPVRDYVGIGPNANVLQAPTGSAKPAEEGVFRGLLNWATGNGREGDPR